MDREVDRRRWMERGRVKSQCEPYAQTRMVPNANRQQTRTENKINKQKKTEYERPNGEKNGQQQQQKQFHISIRYNSIA